MLLPEATQHTWLLNFSTWDLGICGGPVVGGGPSVSLHRLGWISLLSWRNLPPSWNQEESMKDIFLCIQHSHKWKFITGPLSCNPPGNNAAPAVEPDRGSGLAQLFLS